MKNDDPDSRWERLVHRARADAAPSIDVPALRRTVRRAPLERPSAGWTAEFVSLFAAGRVVPACLAGAAACVLFGGWHAWETWQALPWAQLVAATTGGVP